MIKMRLSLLGHTDDLVHIVELVLGIPKLEIITPQA